MCEMVLINLSDLHFGLSNVGDLHCRGGRGSVFVFFVGEDVDANYGGFGGSMFSWFGSGILGHLAGKALEHTVTALLDTTSSCGGAIGGTGLNLLKFLVVGHC